MVQSLSPTAKENETRCSPGKDYRGISVIQPQSSRKAKVRTSRFRRQELSEHQQSKGRLKSRSLQRLCFPYGAASPTFLPGLRF